MSIEILFFVVISLLGQVLYFLFLRKDGAWLGWTIAIEGMLFSLWIVMAIGIFLTFYVLSKKKFLPNWMNKTLYHPKLDKL